MNDAACAGRDRGASPAGTIADYALIGDCGTAALVSRTGSLDWLCLPRFDSDPVFGRILDPHGGAWCLRPRGAFTVARRYERGSGVLATTFTTPDGRATVYDCFAAEGRAAKRQAGWPFRYLIRRIAGERGVVRFDTEIEPADAFRGGRYQLVDRGQRVLARLSGAALLIAAPSPLTVRNGTATGSVDVRAGDVVHFGLSYSGRDVGMWPPLGEFAESAFQRTIAYWRSWSDAANVGGAMGEVVQRSVLTLKLLTFAPSGAVVAAPTTSLPESPRGVRNWDYRYSWIRDASWTVSALNEIGYTAEARAYLFWALNAARLTEPRVNTVYTLHGAPVPRERELSRVRGFADARPVRVGNAATHQLQLDNWGHLVDAAYSYACHGGPVDGDMWASLRHFIQFVADNWTRADQGIWEVRDAPRHFVHSKVMCWVALDRGVRLVRELGFRGPDDAWTRQRDAVRAAVLHQGVDSSHGGLMRAFDDPSTDASLLLIPSTGFLPGQDPRIARTIARVREELGERDLLYRYRGDDGLPGREGAFVACSFWLAHALALAQRADEALRVFERTCRRANDVGLFAEEIDPASGAFLGNFPQGLSHIALVRAALAIARSNQ